MRSVRTPSLDEVEEFLTSAFGMAFSIEPHEAAQLGSSLRECVHLTAVSCFEQHGLNPFTDSVRKQQFVSWYVSAFVGTDGARAFSEDDQGSDAALTIRRFSEITGLEWRTPGEVLEVLSNAADEDVQLSRGEFLTAFRDCILTADQRNKQIVVALILRLFDLFDVNHDGVVVRALSIFVFFFLFSSPRELN